MRLHALELQIGSCNLSWSDRSVTRVSKAIRSDHTLISCLFSCVSFSFFFYPFSSPSAAQIGKDGSRTLGVVKCHISSAERQTEAQIKADWVNDHLQCSKSSSPTLPADSSCTSTPVAPRLLLLLDFFSPSTPPALRILLLLLDTCCSSTPVAP